VRRSDDTSHDSQTVTVMLNRLVRSQMHPQETRKLSTDELTTVFRPILDQVRLILLRASNGDSQFH